MATITKGKVAQLSLLQDPSYGVPSDVTFQIISVTSEGAAEIIQVLGEVTGHKNVLAAFSKVFRDQFFGKLKEEKDVIPVKETTYEAFQKLMFFIYSKDIDWGGVTVPEMFDVVNLAEKYIMPELMDEMKKQMENVPITNNDTLFEVAHAATEFAHLFPDVSAALLLTCAKFVQKTIPPSEQFQFAKDQSGTGKEAIVLQLLVLADDLPALVECSNCGSVPCVDGQVVVGADKFTAGLKLRVNKTVTAYWGVNGGKHAGKVYTVLRVINNNVVSVKCESDGSTNDFYHIWQNGPTFCYGCTDAS
eukprot:GFUD01000609.1.p1 GENE.GFUD01000609.1~~GFUD01000609.1.p1  ORF type:complete len:320 (-),score=59.54 GFUD01000609.1:542-1453(-)